MPTMARARSSAASGAQLASRPLPHDGEVSGRRVGEVAALQLQLAQEVARLHAARRVAEAGDHVLEVGLGGGDVAGVVGFARGGQRRRRIQRRRGRRGFARPAAARAPPAPPPSAPARRHEPSARRSPRAAGRPRDAPRRRRGRPTPAAPVSRVIACCRSSIFCDSAPIWASVSAGWTTTGWPVSRPWKTMARSSLIACSIRSRRLAECSSSGCRAGPAPAPARRRPAPAPPPGRGGSSLAASCQFILRASRSRRLIARPR